MSKTKFTFYMRRNVFWNCKPWYCIDLFDEFITVILNYSTEYCGFQKGNYRSGTFDGLYEVGSCKKNHHDPWCQCVCMVFKTRLLDIHQQDWHSRLSASTGRFLPSLFNKSPVLVCPLLCRIVWTSLGTNAHRMEIGTGRWQSPKLPRESWKCVGSGKLDD